MKKMSDKEPNRDSWNGSWEQLPELDKMVNESMHPEMQNIDPNEEFMVMKFEGLKDELGQKLQDRIDELKKKEDDENGDGGLVVRK